MHPGAVAHRVVNHSSAGRSGASNESSDTRASDNGRSIGRVHADFNVHGGSDHGSIAQAEKASSNEGVSRQIGGTCSMTDRANTP